MEIYARRVVVDMPFNAALQELTTALGDHGFSVLGRFNLRAYLGRTLHVDFRQYVLLEVAMPHVVRDALREDVAIGPLVPATIAVFELGDGETAVAVAEPFGGLASRVEWRESSEKLAALADETCEHLAAALDELEQDARAFATLGSLVISPIAQPRSLDPVTD